MTTYTPMPEQPPKGTEAMIETETIDRLFLELSQVTKAKTKRELELERALRRQAQSHTSICDLLRQGASDIGIEACITQCARFATEAQKLLGIEPCKDSP